MTDDATPFLYQITRDATVYLYVAMNMAEAIKLDRAAWHEELPLEEQERATELEHFRHLECVLEIGELDGSSVAATEWLAEQM